MLIRLELNIDHSKLNVNLFFCGHQSCWLTDCLSLHLDAYHGSIYEKNYHIHWRISGVARGRGKSASALAKWCHEDLHNTSWKEMRGSIFSSWRRHFTLRQRRKMWTLTRKTPSLANVTWFKRSSSRNGIISCPNIARRHGCSIKLGYVVKGSWHRDFIRPKAPCDS